MVKIEALVFVAIFSLIFIFIGFYYRHKKHPEEFFMAGRKAGLLKVVSSIVTLLGAGEIVTLTAFAYIISTITFVIGIFMLINSQSNITGAIIGVTASTNSILSSFLGIIFIISGIVLFATTHSELEKITLSSAFEKIDEKVPFYIFP